MTNVTLEQLKTIMPHSGARAEKYLPHLNATMLEFEINTPARRAMFLAQLAHESGELKYVREIASGAAYEGRVDLGNIRAGDGKLFRGRGLIQITGRRNYTDCSLSLCGDLRLLTKPELLESDELACRSAGWFWKQKNLNGFADRGDIAGATRRINGGQNGLADRMAFFRRAQGAL